MVIAHHLIMTAYGWWLPNDPRGSSSSEIRVEHIADLGELHYGRKSQQPLSSELRTFYEQAQSRLKQELLPFTDADLLILAASFGEAIRKHGWTCYACALMPDHVHLLIRTHRDKAETMMLALQDHSRERLRSSRGRSSVHPVWGGPGWKVFVLDTDQMKIVIRYIEQNPIKARRPAQRWKFVTSYDGWLPGLQNRKRSK